jgi:hypothetical protein
VTTGAMALICPHREQCEFWVPECADWLERFPHTSGDQQ